MGERILLDTNVPIYASGRAHPLREPCRAVLQAGAAGHLDFEASIEMIQEFGHLLLRRGTPREDAVAQMDEVRRQCPRLYAFDEAVLDLAQSLIVGTTSVGMRDAVHAATAVLAGGIPIISADKGFDDIDVVRRIDPADAPWWT